MIFTHNQNRSPARTDDENVKKGYTKRFFYASSTPNQHCVAKPETEAIISVALCKVQTDVGPR